MNFNEKLQKYADLCVKLGVNIQKDQTLVINCPIECADFARLVAESAYKNGAKEVVMFWNDEKFSKIKYTYSPQEVFESVPQWLADSRNYYGDLNCATIRIVASDPEIFKDVDSKKLAAENVALRKATKPFRDRIDAGHIAWNIVSVPSAAWAKKVFPDCTEQQAIEQLWNAIFKAVRVDQDDTIGAWNDHKETLFAKAKYLNEKQFVSFHYKNSIGTDLVVGMPDNYVFEGGGDKTLEGVYYFPNMPTEEVFSMPHREKVNGTVVSAMPLNYQGTLVKDFSITFKDGRVESITAKEGYEALSRLIDTDEGSHYLGEIALVPNKSPISDTGILFYNTLFDENASCHFALGSAYPTCIKDGLTYTKDELTKLGGNDSIEHQDFMVGTADLNITATDKEGNEVPIFINGNWAI